MFVGQIGIEINVRLARPVSRSMFVPWHALRSMFPKPDMGSRSGSDQCSYPDLTLDQCSRNPTWAIPQCKMSQTWSPTLISTLICLRSGFRNIDLGSGQGTNIGLDTGLAKRTLISTLICLQVRFEGQWPQLERS